MDTLVGIPARGCMLAQLGRTDDRMDVETMVMVMAEAWGWELG